MVSTNVHKSSFDSINVHKISFDIESVHNSRFDSINVHKIGFDSTNVNFKSVLKYISEQLTRTFAVLVFYLPGHEEWAGSGTEWALPVQVCS